jgi:hypothetical protein
VIAIAENAVDVAADVIAAEEIAIATVVTKIRIATKTAKVVTKIVKAVIKDVMTRVRKLSRTSPLHVRFRFQKERISCR